MIQSLTSPTVTVPPRRPRRCRPSWQVGLAAAALPALWLGLVVIAGCGGPTSHPVTGTVTLDGEPLADAIVSFVPDTPQGTWASGRTVDQGRFVLRQGTGADGTAAGQYTVRFTTYREGNDDVDPPLPTVPEKVPRRYNAESQLRVEVGPERGGYEFDLRTRGEPVVRVGPASALATAPSSAGQPPAAAPRRPRTVWYLLTVLIWLLVLAACYAWWRHNERQWQAARKQPTF